MKNYPCYIGIIVNHDKDPKKNSCGVCWESENSVVLGCPVGS